MSFLIGENRKIIIDKTLIGNIKEEELQSKSDLLKMIIMLNKIGVDYIEVDNNIIKILSTLLPENIEYIYRIENIDDFKTYPLVFFFCAVVEYSLFIEINKMKTYDSKIKNLIVEIDYNDINTEDKIISIIESFDFKSIYSIRIINVYNDLFFEENNVINIIRQYAGSNIKIDICADNRSYLGTASAINALINGADSITTAIFGIDNKYGLAATEEVLLSLKYVLKAGISGDTTILKILSELYEKISGNVINGMKPIVGRDIFKYESGVHADGIEKNPATYEPYNPNVVGLERKLVIGKHSGSKAIVKKLHSLGIECDNDDIKKVLKFVREKSIEVKRGLKDEELIQIYKKVKEL